MIGITVIRARIVRSPGLRRAATDLTVANTAAAPEVSESNFSPRKRIRRCQVVVALCGPIDVLKIGMGGGRALIGFPRDNEVISRLPDHIERSIQPPRYYPDGVAQRDGSSGAGSHSGRKRTWRGCKVTKIVGEG